jgi:hypothetical protein
MALIAFGDFIGYSIAQASRYWLTVDGAITINSTGGRFSNSPCLYMVGGTGASILRSRAFSPIAAGVIGMSVKFSNTNTNPTSILSLYDGPSNVEHVRIVRLVDGTLSFTRANTALTGGITATSFADDIWHWIEIKFSIANSIGANSCQIYVNGGLEATVATGQDTQNGGTAFITQFGLGRAASGPNIAATYSEFYLQDDTTPLGDRRVETLFPNGNGATQDFASSSGGHYTDVDDTTADDDSTYVESTTAGDIELFDIQNMSSTPTDITAASIWSCVRKTDAGEKSAAAVLRQSSTNYDQATFYPSTSYQYNSPILTTDPATAAAWTESGINSAQIGLKVIS